MNQIHRKLTAALAALAVCTTVMPLSASADYGAGGNGTAVMEYLDRGIYAVNSGNGMFVSWRYNADDPDNAVYQLYRDGELIYTSKAGDPTCYQDAGGSAASKYRVDTLNGSKVISSEDCKFTSNSNYFDVPLKVPQGGSINGEAFSYSPNDTVVGDVDGDGQYELFVKWDPSNAKDNSQSGVTGNVYIDCYTLTGTMLWRIDLGRNIRAGQHYTQLCVADFDSDGKAELITKTGDGTVDGTGKVIGNGSADYRNDGGYVLTGPEYLSLFDGQTGAAKDTIAFPVERGDATSSAAKNTWGDNYGNRVDRFNSGIAYLDGVHPSAIYGRGYYTRMTVSAIDVVNGKLSVRWKFDTGFDSNVPGWGDGNHNLMTADVDNDGKQEICMGSTMIDDNGKLLWCNRKGHGDAMHLGDLVPDRPGLELFMCHEHAPYGVSLIDAATGQDIFHYDGDKDTGRCCADNVWSGNPGAEFWGSRPANTIMDAAGKTLSNIGAPQNFLIYWDGDLEREMLNDITISKFTAADKITDIFTASGCASNNGTKAVPCLTADLFGDWREELLLRTEDNSRIRVFCTTASTDVRLTTLMHDTQYRTQTCCEQSSYNQPPHTSFYLGTGSMLPERPSVVVNGSNTGTVSPAAIDTSKVYVLKNKNSGLMLGAEGKAESNANVSQQTADNTNPANMWRFVQCEEDCYILQSVADPSLGVGLDGAEENGTNIMLIRSAATPFHLYRAGAGYVLTTAASEDANCIEVGNAAEDANANVNLWERNGHDCQIWILESVPYHAGSAVGRPGDLDSNGAVNAIDLTLLKRDLIAGSNTSAADVTADGKVTVADAVYLARFLTDDAQINSVFCRAIDASYMYGVEESTNAGFESPAYLNLDNVTGSFAEFTAYVPKADKYMLNVRYANGSDANRIMDISVNGTKALTQDFNGTGTWTTWETANILVSLEAGANIIRLTSAMDQGGPNLDWFEVKPAS